MNITLLLVLHWTLNIFLMLACLGAVGLGIFGQGADMTTLNRIMLEVVGVGFGVLAFFFTRYTLAKG